MTGQSQRGASFRKVIDERWLTTGDDDNEQKNDDANSETDSHPHVLPPHLFSDPVGAATEALGRVGEVVGLVLQAVEVLATFRDLVDVGAHDVDGRVDLL